MAGPYTDIRVLDFSRDMAGRYATMMMADMGAEVIRVESPDAVSKGSTQSNRLFDRGKKSIFLDLRFFLILLKSFGIKIPPAQVNKILILKNYLYNSIVYMKNTN